MRAAIIFCLCLLAFSAQAQDDVNYTYMDSLFQQLPEVLVKGERPVVKAERGKLVYDLPRMVERLPVNNAYEEQRLKDFTEGIKKNPCNFVKSLPKRNKRTCFDTASNH